MIFIQQQIMKRLIKRYVLKAQVDKENDEVNEGERHCKQHFLILLWRTILLFILLGALSTNMK